DSRVDPDDFGALDDQADIPEDAALSVEDRRCANHDRVRQILRERSRRYDERGREERSKTALRGLHSALHQSQHGDADPAHLTDPTHPTQPSPNISIKVAAATATGDLVADAVDGHAILREDRCCD